MNEAIRTSQRQFRLQRRSLLSRHPHQLGVDFVRAAQSGGEWQLQVWFVPSSAEVPKLAVPHGLQPRHFRIERLDGAGSVPEVAAVRYPPSAAEYITLELRKIPPASEGIFQSLPYVLHLEHVPWLNGGFASAVFSLHPAAGTELPASPGAEPEAGPLPEAAVNYLAKDYQSFLTLMQNHLSLTAPEWRERHAPDLGVALLELLAYAGDHLSYYQDAVATEAYLGTALQRISLRRHARLLDYRVGEGCNARVWVQLCVRGDSVNLPAGSAFASLPIRAAGETPGARATAVHFRSMHAAALHESHNLLPIHCWGVEDFALEAGATSVALTGAVKPALEAGDVLLFEETSEHRSVQNPASLPRRHVVRLRSAPVIRHDALAQTDITMVAWDAADALPFRLPVAARLADGTKRTDLAMARGNMILADHGDVAVVPVRFEIGRATLGREAGALLWAVPYDHSQACREPAAAAVDPPAPQALPCLTLTETRPGSKRPARAWHARSDLLSSDRYAREFVVERENDGRVTLRTAHGSNGRRVTPDAHFHARCRVGLWSDGLIAAETLVLTGDANPGIVSVRNPLPSRAAVPPLDSENIRMYAPEHSSLRISCVTPDDYAGAAAAHPEVHQAAARRMWCGSEAHVVIYAARRGGRPVDARFAATLRDFLEPRRLLGDAVEVRGAAFASLLLGLNVTLHRGHQWPAVRAALAAALSDQANADGRSGFFQPDQYPFGQTIYLSQVVAAAAAVAGVARVTPTAFQRWREHAARQLHDYIQMGELELPRLRNDPAQPSHGLLRLRLEGSR